MVHIDIEITTPGRVYTTESFASPGCVSSTGALAGPGQWICLDNSSMHALLLNLSTYATETCAALGRVYTLGPDLHLDVSTLHSSVLHLDVSTLQRPWT
jgi:hypothetical protein